MWLGVLVQWGWAQEESDCDFQGPAATVTWSASDGGDLLVTGAPGVEWIVRVEARFGSSSHRWEGEAVTADEAAVARLPLSPPAASRLDPLADTYVTDLSIRVVGTDAEGASRVVVAPPGFLAWDRTGAPTVWSAEGLARHAPHGVTEPSLVPAGLPEGTRVLPPVFRVVAMPQEVAR